MSRFLVTGAAGFIGRHLCRRLQEDGHWVRALVRRPMTGPWDHCIACDLASDPLPSGLAAGIEGVFHLAGIAHLQDASGAPEALYRRVNLDATNTLVELAAASGVRGFIFFSSVKAAADPGAECVDETWTAAPNDAYGRSKLDAERLVLNAGARTGMHVCVLRPTLVYGPGVKGNLETLIIAAKRGRCPPLPEFHNRRSLIGRDDLIEAALLAMQEPRAVGKTYIVSDGQVYSTRQLVTAICAAAGKRMPRWTVPAWALRMGALTGDALGALLRRPMPLRSAVYARLAGSACYRSTRLRDDLGWRPRQSFCDCVGDMAEAHRRASEPSL